MVLLIRPRVSRRCFFERALDDPALRPPRDEAIDLILKA